MGCSGLQCLGADGKGAGYPVCPRSLASAAPACSLRLWGALKMTALWRGWDGGLVDQPGSAASPFQPSRFGLSYMDCPSD